MLTLLVVPGKVFSENELVTTAKLNQLGQPTIQVLNDDITFIVADGSITVSKLADGCLTADATGRAKMQDGFLTAEKGAQDLLDDRAQYAEGTYTSATGVYAVTLDPAATAYAEGMRIAFKASAANVSDAGSGACQVAVNGLANTALKRGAAALVPGEIAAGAIVEAVYDGTNFQVLSQGQGYYASAATAIAGGKLIDAAHGLGGLPRRVRAVLVCDKAGGAEGYAQNDEIDLGGVHFKNSTAENVPCYTWGANATNVFLVGHNDLDDGVAGTGMRIPNKTNGNLATLVRTEWKVKVYAWRDAKE